MHVTEAFLAQKHTDGRRCRHMRTAHAGVLCKGLSDRKLDYNVRVKAPEEASLSGEHLWGLRKCLGLGFRV